MIHTPYAGKRGRSGSSSTSKSKRSNIEVLSSEDYIYEDEEEEVEVASCSTSSIVPARTPAPVPKKVECWDNLLHCLVKSKGKSNKSYYRIEVKAKQCKKLFQEEMLLDSNDDPVFNAGVDEENLADHQKQDKKNDRKRQIVRAKLKERINKEYSAMLAPTNTNTNKLTEDDLAKMNDAVGLASQNASHQVNLLKKKLLDQRNEVIGVAKNAGLERDDLQNLLGILELVDAGGKVTKDLFPAIAQYMTFASKQQEYISEVDFDFICYFQNALTPLVNTEQNATYKQVLEGTVIGEDPEEAQKEEQKKIAEAKKEAKAEAKAEAQKELQKQIAVATAKAKAEAKAEAQKELQKQIDEATAKAKAEAKAEAQKQIADLQAKEVLYSQELARSRGTAIPPGGPTALCGPAAVATALSGSGTNTAEAVAAVAATSYQAYMKYDPKIIVKSVTFFQWYYDFNNCKDYHQHCKGVEEKIEKHFEGKLGKDGKKRDWKKEYAAWSKSKMTAV